MNFIMFTNKKNLEGQIWMLVSEITTRLLILFSKNVDDRNWLEAQNVLNTGMALPESGQPTNPFTPTNWR